MTRIGGALNREGGTGTLAAHVIQRIQEVYKYNVWHLVWNQQPSFNRDFRSDFCFETII